MEPLKQYIASNIGLDYYRDDEGQWESTPFWYGEPMKVFIPELSNYCRDLFYFNVDSRRYLMKIDRDPSFLQCNTEIELWGRIDKSHKRYFVPIMLGNTGNDGSPSWVVCPFVPNLGVTNLAHTDHHDFVSDLEDTYMLRDVQFNKNWFMYHGRPLIVDFGVKKHW